MFCLSYSTDPIKKILQKIVFYLDTQLKLCNLKVLLKGLWSLFHQFYIKTEDKPITIIFYIKILIFFMVCYSIFFLLFCFIFAQLLFLYMIWFFDGFNVVSWVWVCNAWWVVFSGWCGGGPRRSFTSHSLALAAAVGSLTFHARNATTQTLLRS